MLVVEDEVLVRLAVAEALRARGFRVIEACCAQEAFDILAAGVTPDTLLTDVRMPGSIDGLELAAFVESQHPSIPIFITSAYIHRADLRISINFLPKPLQPETVALLISNTLGAI